MVISNRIVRLLAAGALALSAPALAACSTDQPTDKVYNQAVGTNERHASSIDVLNAMIVSTEPGSGTLITTLVNNDNKATTGDNSEVTLTGVSVDDVPAKVAKGLTIVASEHLVLAVRGAGGIKVEGDFEAGEFVEVTFTFDEAEPVTLEIPVVTNTGYHAGEDGAPAPVEEPTEDETHEAEAH